MAYRLCKLFLFIALGLMIGCSGKSNPPKKTGLIKNPEYGKWQKKDKSPLTFKRKLTIGNQKDLLFASAWYLKGPVVDESGNIYVIDSKKEAMYSFGPDGRLRWKKGEKGKGPGDFDQPLGLAIAGNTLYTANVSGSRIDQFDLKGNLVVSTPLDKFDLTFVAVRGFIDDSLLVVSSTIMGTLGAKITLLNTKNHLNKVSQFKIIPNPKMTFSKHLGMGLDINVTDSLIATGNNGTYAIIFYDKKGKKVKTISRNFHKLVLFGHYQTSSGDAGIGGFGSLGAPINLHNGYYLVHLSWPINVKNPDQFLKKSMPKGENSKKAIYKNALDLYNTNGTLLYSQTTDGSTPNIGTIAYVDSRGNIYTKTNDPFPQIRKYKVIVGTPVNVGEH